MTTKFKWWHPFLLPIILGLITIILVMAGFVHDHIEIDGSVIENGFHTFLFGTCLIKIGVTGLALVYITKKISALSQNLKKKYFGSN